MPITIDFDIKEDVFYKEGLAEGREEGRVEGQIKSYFKIICNGMDFNLETSILMQLTGFSEEKVLEIIDGIRRRDIPFLSEFASLTEENT